MKMTETTGEFRSSDATLFYRSWLKKGAKNNLIIHHGYGEHSGRYGNVVEALKSLPLNIHALDARGHGNTPGQRGHADGVAQMSADLSNFIDFLSVKKRGKKPLLLGHSMGGLVCLHFCVHGGQQKIRALVANGSALAVEKTAAMKMKAAVGKLLKKVTPRLSMAAGLPLKFLSHDESVIRAYTSDRLVTGKISAALGISILEEGEKTLALARELTIPVLLTHGKGDGLIPCSGTEEFHRNCSSKDKTLILYEGLYHEVYNEKEPEKSRVLSDLKKWIRKHM